MSFPTVDTDVVRSLEGLAALAVAALTPFVARLTNAHVSAKNLATADSIFAKAVKAAEQLGIGKIGSEKFQLAKAAVIRDAARHGITLTDAEIQTGIEAAVTDLKATGVAIVSDAPPAAPTAEQTKQATASLLRAAADQIAGASVPVVAPAPTVVPSDGTAVSAPDLTVAGPAAPAAPIVTASS